MQNRTCVIDSPNYDCIYTGWSQWTSCTETCGAGSQLRSREILRDGSGTGARCNSLYQSQPCSLNPCYTNPCSANPCRLGRDSVTDVIGDSFTCVEDANAYEGRNCTDIDACLYFACQAGSYCVDMPFPAINNTNGRTCVACDGITGFQNVSNYDSTKSGTGCYPMTAPCAIGYQESVHPSITQDRFCQVCLAGTTDDDRNPVTPCAFCAAGQYCPEGSFDPPSSHQCPSGTVSSDSNPAHPCSVCNLPGHYMPPGSYGDCSTFVCPAGTSDDDSSPSTPCVSCIPGEYTPAGSVGACSLFVCGANTTDADFSAATACVTCTSGTYVPAGSVGTCSSLQCAAGSTDDDFNPSTTCVSCSVGHYVPSGSSGSCTQFSCFPSTTDSDSNSATPCITCLPGTYVPAMSTGICSAYLCPPGTFDDDLNPSTPCHSCPTQTFQPLYGQISCNNMTICQVGQQQALAPTSTSDRACTYCLLDQTAGTWQNQSSQLSCYAATVCNLTTQFASTQATISTDRVCTYLCSANGTGTCSSGIANCSSPTSANCAYYNRLSCGSQVNVCGACLSDFVGPPSANAPCNFSYPIPIVAISGSGFVTSLSPNITFGYLQNQLPGSSGAITVSYALGSYTLNFASAVPVIESVEVSLVMPNHIDITITLTLCSF